MLIPLAQKVLRRTTLISAERFLAISSLLKRIFRRKGNASFCERNEGISNSIIKSAVINNLMDNKFEKSFKKNTGKETKVQVISEIRIAGGTFGEIFDTVVEIGGHRKRFIVKKYRENNLPVGKPIATKNAHSAFENYSLAKEAGLKVFPTFRISEDEKDILMTTGFLKDQICIGSNNAKDVTKFDKPLIREISNTDEFLSNIFAEYIKAAKNNIYLPSDILFFVLNRDEPTNLDFVLGDLDNLRKESRSIAGIASLNIRNLRSSLYYFSNENIDPEKRQKFNNKIEYYSNQAVDIIYDK